MKVKIYTDGACSGNPGPGGYAALFMLPEQTVMYSNGARNTTNNRMELTAVVKALEIFIESYSYMPYDSVEIYSDSAYVVNAVKLGWLWRWKDNKWITLSNNGHKHYVRNYDLWRRLLKAFSDFEWLNISLDFVKVAGHAGIECNEMVDQAAKKEVEKIKLLNEGE